MSGAGYGTLGMIPDQPMHISPPVRAAQKEPEEEVLYNNDCQG